MKLGRSSSFPSSKDNSYDKPKSTGSSGHNTSGTSTSNAASPPPLTRSTSMPKAGYPSNPAFQSSGFAAAPQPPYSTAYPSSNLGFNPGPSPQNYLGTGSSAWDFPNVPTHSPTMNNATPAWDFPDAPTHSPIMNSTTSAWDFPDVPTTAPSLAPQLSRGGLSPNNPNIGPNHSTNLRPVEINRDINTQVYSPPSTFDDQAIRNLRQSAANENYLGMRFGGTGNENGFIGDAYSLVPSEFGAHPHLLERSSGLQMSDAEFSQSVGASISKGVDWEISKLPNRDTIRMDEAINDLSGRYNMIIADMGSPPTLERYQGPGDTQTTPKFGRRDVDADAIHSQIRLTGDSGNGNVPYHAIARDQQELLSKMSQSPWGIDIHAPLSGQEDALRNFLTDELSTTLNGSVNSYNG